ncbi:polyketide synthase [Colletotrichum eremochloae]|nr:polyketide synthase [Colletotrichum eremochloae]
MGADKVEPIAIVGLNLKFPEEADSPQGFWKMLCDARNVATEPPEGRYNIDAFYHPDPARLDATRVRKACYMKEDPRAFDAPFFSMPLATIVDPMQRCLLEGAYRTFENGNQAQPVYLSTPQQRHGTDKIAAGIPMAQVAGSKTSVYCANFARDQETIVSHDPEYQSRYQSTATGYALLSNRISHFYDLKGPSLTVDTACSSGLYALHLAVQSILLGESDMSLVCGANTCMTPEAIGIVLDNSNFLSKDGRCFSFDHRANGYGRGEGFGFVLIKKLSDAIRDGDCIRAVIRGTGANQDGRTPSITQPGPDAQRALIKDTYERAGLGFEQTQFMEAHGTGTLVGDPIEAGAIGETFRPSRKEPLYIGSVKSNIGHLEGASGLAGLIKIVLALEKGVIPPNADFGKVNPALDLDGLKLRIPTKAVPWPTEGLRRASVSSFGYGGSNAHAILDDAYNYLKARRLEGIHNTVDKYREHDLGNGRVNGNGMTNGNGHSNESWAIISLSAQDEDGPKRQAQALQAHLSSETITTDDKTFLLDLCHTLFARRSVLNWRSAAVVSFVADASANLISGAFKALFTLPSKTPVLSYVFTGQGAQYAKMGLGLYESYPIFRASIEQCDVFLFKELGCPWSVVEELKRDADFSKINQPLYSQPLCTAIQVALVDLLKSWDLAPASVIGHSSGEIAAAYSAGAITRDSAWRIAYQRGVLSEKLVAASTAAPTTMMSVGLGEEDIAAYLEGTDVTVACVNSPINVTVSGPAKSIKELHARLDAAEIFAKRLAVKIGYHSTVMTKGSAEYDASLKGGIHSPPPPGKDGAGGPVRAVMYSSVTGKAIDLDELTKPSYWVSNLVSAVKFAPALSAMTKETKAGNRFFFLELGPQAGLRRPIKDTLARAAPKSLKWQYAPVLSSTDHHVKTTLEAVAAMWSDGVDVDLDKVNASSLPATTAPKIMVDLPSYPFSRAKWYWEESRLSRNYAFRPFRRHALLGIRDKDWNESEGSWKHTITIDENPWIRDHAFNGSPIYPGSGMLVMAIEAVRQLATPHEARIKGYRVSSVRMLRPIQVDASEHGAEAKIHLRPRKLQLANDQMPWYDFRIYTIQADEWTEAAFGSVKVKLEPEKLADDQRAAAKVREAKFAAELKAEYDATAKLCTLTAHSKQFYSNVSKKSGFNYGPYFQLLNDITYDRAGHVTASLNLRDYAKHMDQMVGLSRGGWYTIPTMMFTHLQELYVSHKLFTTPGNPRLLVASQETLRGFRECICRTIAIFEDTMEPAIICDGQRGTAISSLATTVTTDTETTGLMSYAIDFKPHVPLLPKLEELRPTLAAGIVRKKGRDQEYDRTNRSDAIMLHYAKQVVAKIEAMGKRPWDEGHFFERYLGFLKHVVDEEARWDPKGRGLGALPIEQMLVDAHLDPGCAINKHVGDHLLSILEGKTSALQVIFEDNLADAFYHSELTSALNRVIGEYAKVLSHNNPNLRLLELGAGTGSSAAKILPALVHDMGNGHEAVRCGEYMYTDISSGFFEKARERFSFAAPAMKFAKLDIETDPSEQGFEVGAYDVVVAGNVLHVTKDLVQTLKNVRKLLKPGGSLCLAELVNVDTMRHAFVFGLLPGWWLRTAPDGPGHTDQGPLLSAKQWDQAFRDAGFTGVQLEFQDFEDPLYHQVSMLITTNPTELPAPAKAPTSGTLGQYAVVADPASAAQTALCKEIQARFGPSPVYELAAMANLSDADLEETTVISLVELTRPVLATATAADFDGIKRLSMRSKMVVWLTTGLGPVANNPDGEVIIGFGRAVCSERAEQAFVILSLEKPLADTRATLETLARVLDDAKRSDTSSRETEYVEADGVLHTPRLIPAGHVNQAILARTKTPDPEPYTIGSTDPASKPHFYLTIETPGLLDTLYYAEDPAAAEPPAPGYCEVEVKVAGLNFRDVMIALGGVPGGSFGCDGAGVISRASPGSKFKPGDRVIYCSNDGRGFGTYAHYVDQDLTLIPDGMPFQVAAAISAVWRTVVYSFDYLARLRKGQSVLIHAGAGGVGQAAIQLAKLRGAGAIYVTVGNAEKRGLVKSLYNIPDSHIFYSRDASFKDDVLRATGGKGVDVVLNCLSGELLQASWDCIAPLGSFIDIGKGDAILNNNLLMGPFSRNVSFSCVDLSLVSKADPELMTRIMADVLDLFASHPDVLHEPRPLHVYAPDMIEEAFRFVQSGKNTGKVLIDYETVGTTVQYQPRLKAAYQFPANASYLIAGGLGGLGREITRWMVERGARHFLLLNSRGVNNVPEVISFLKELDDQGVKHMEPACDCSNRAALEEVLAKAKATGFPAVRGCIQGAMKLDDDAIGKMPVSKLHAALNPKRVASWNLHELLPKDLDFFVLLSSFCGVFGNPGQSNYAAGGTFEDAFARYRTSLGQKAVSIDLALVAEAGWANDNYELVANNLRTHDGMHNDQLMALLDVLCDPGYDSAAANKNNSQIVTIVDTPRQIFDLTEEGRIVWPTKPMFRHLLRLGKTSDGSSGAGKEGGDDGADTIEYVTSVKQAPTVEEAGEIIARGVVQKLAKSLSVEADRLDVSRPAYVLGVDSLIAVELRYWFAKRCGIEVPVFVIMKNQPVSELCVHAATKVLSMVS